MESDIVLRLRSNSRFFGLVKLGSRATIEPEFCAETAEWFNDAADEIERLRAELADARQIIFRLQTSAACCRTSPAATTRDGEEPFISEAL